MGITKKETVFGWELLLTLVNCDISTFTRKSLRRFFKEICDLIEMEREDLHFWDYEDMEIPPEEQHLAGVSAVQFIKTSNITIHTLDNAQRVYMNLFSCKKFDHEEAVEFTKEWFKGNIKAMQFIMRD